MKKTIPALLILAVATFAAPVTFADDATAKAEKLLLVVKMDELIGKQRQIVVDQIIAARGDLANKRTELDKIIGDALNYEAFKKFATELYVKNFNAEELDQIIKFYESPTGQKTLTKMPEITEQSFKFSQERLEQAKPKVEALIKNASGNNKVPEAEKTTTTKP